MTDFYPLYYPKGATEMEKKKVDNSTVEVKIVWNDESKEKEYGWLYIPIPEEVGIRLHWNGTSGHPIAYVIMENGVPKLRIQVKRDKVKEVKRGKSKELCNVPSPNDI